MARLPRVSPVHVPIHIVQRGNNRHICFGCEDDYGVYVDCLKEYLKKYSVEVHAFNFTLTPFDLAYANTAKFNFQNPITHGGVDNLALQKKNFQETLVL